MMNRDRISRSRTTTRSNATTFGLDERLERVLLYPIALLASVFAPLGWLPGLIVYFVEKNRNVRWHALQSAVVFGVLSIVYALVLLVKWILGGVFLLNLITNLALGLLASGIWWVMILLAIWLTFMTWFRPGYRLPFVGKLIDSTFGRWM